MPTKHNIALDIPEVSCAEIMKIVDASVYAEGLGVDCQRLDIYLPGFTVPVYITENLPEGFIRTISAVDLNIQTVEDPLVALPDGLYTIRYSISPAEYVYVEYYHLRTTQLMNQYYREICKVQLSACEPTSEQHQKLHDLRYIKQYIDAAKAKAEYCHSPVQATEMMAYAQKLLVKYQSGSCLTCC